MTSAPKRTNIGGAHTHAKQKAHNMAQRQYFSPRVSEVTEMKLSPAHICDVDQWTLNIVDVQHTKILCVVCAMNETLAVKAVCNDEIRSQA